jgi:hypothetical protein
MARVKHLQHINSFNLLKQHLREVLGEDFHLYDLTLNNSNRTVDVTYHKSKYARVTFELDGYRNWQLYYDTQYASNWICDMETINDAFEAINLIDETKFNIS